MIEENKISNMLPDELEKMIKFLQDTLGKVTKDKGTISRLVNRENNNHCCPYCKSSNIIKNGHSKKNTKIQMQRLFTSFL